MLTKQPAAETQARNEAEISVGGICLTDEHRAQAVGVMYEAFDQKLHNLLVLTKSEATIRRILPLIIDFSQSVIAIRDDVVCGVMFLNFGKRNFFHYDWRIAHREFGIFGAIYRRINHALVNSHRRLNDELNIQAFAVRSAERNQGIGANMLQLAETFGIDNGYGFLSLEVVDTNARAKHLYERNGFQTKYSKSTWPLTRAAGFDGYDYMTKGLTTSP